MVSKLTIDVSKLGFSEFIRVLEKTTKYNFVYASPTAKYKIVSIDKDDKTTVKIEFFANIGDLFARLSVYQCYGWFDGLYVYENEMFIGNKTIDIGDVLVDRSIEDISKYEIYFKISE